MKKKRASLDYYLILVTVGVLFAISAICIYGMFYFKLADIHQLPASEKIAYMTQMNAVVSPFIVSLILLLGICVPKRLLPTVWMVRLAAFLAIADVGVWLIFTGKIALVVMLVASLVLQLIVLFMAIAGSERLHFEKSGYWVRVGSSLVHLGIILFVLDVFFYKNQQLHLILFWITTGASVLGMLFCFYSKSAVELVQRVRG
jgi:hypothetical protein